MCERVYECAGVVNICNWGETSSHLLVVNNYSLLPVFHEPFEAGGARETQGACGFGTSSEGNRLGGQWKQRRNNGGRNGSNGDKNGSSAHVT